MGGMTAAVTNRDVVVVNNWLFECLLTINDQKWEADTKESFIFLFMFFLL